MLSITREDILTSDVTFNQSSRDIFHADSKRLLVSAINATLPKPKQPLYELARAHFERHGKLLRAVSSLSVSEAIGLERQCALSWSVACELLHNASLIHDDICDEDLERRGRETIAKKYGVPSAICFGDWLISKALDCATRASRHSHACSADVIDYFSSGLKTLTEAQSREFDGTQFLNWNEYEEVVDGKTLPLLLLAFEGPFVLSKGLETDKIAIRDVCVHLSRAYQILNDVDDFVIDESGTVFSNDLKRRAPSAMVISFCDSLVNGNKLKFETWFLEKSTEELNVWAKKIMESSAQDVCIEKVKYHIEQYGRLKCGMSRAVSEALDPWVTFIDSKYATLSAAT